ncbi:hypothetical protein P4S72_03595 [Vibrio sp. PP-XX7]
MKTNIIQFPHPERPGYSGYYIQTLEDAAFFWSQRDAIIGRRGILWNKCSMVGLKKCSAHIRGMQAAGKIGWQLALTGLEREEAEEKCSLQRLLPLLCRIMKPAFKFCWINSRMHRI